MQYQVVLQIPQNSIRDFDKMTAIEDDLRAVLEPQHEVDGNDWGSGTINYFILTDDFSQIIEPAKTVFGKYDLITVLKAAYRSLDADDYIALWPSDLKSFDLMKY